MIDQLFAYLKKKDYVSKTRKIIMSKLSNVEAMTNLVKENYLDIVVSYKRLRTNKNESSKLENKNNADFRFYIEVMNCLYLENPDGFVFASGDKDYTELVLELRKQGKYLIGMGNRKNTSPKYINLFDEFIFTEDLQNQIDLKKEEENRLKEELRLEMEKAQEEERKKKEAQEKKLQEQLAREQKAKKKEENIKKAEELKLAKQQKEEKLLQDFAPLVASFIANSKPGKYLLSTITSKIKEANKGLFPRKIPTEIYAKLGYEVKHEDNEKVKAYLEIPEKVEEE